jgi:hypothetical protein
MGLVELSAIFFFFFGGLPVIFDYTLDPQVRMGWNE